MDTSIDDPAYRAAVTDLLGVLAYGELSASLRMAADGVLAPSLAIQAGIARLAATDYRHYEVLVGRMDDLGIDAEAAMQPFVAPFTGFHERTRPNDWLEGLTKAYIGDGIARDFYQEMAAFVDEGTREIMASALDSQAASDFIVEVVTAAIKLDSTAAGRLALWGRRLLGEALSNGQLVAAERDALAGLLVGSGADLTQVGQMFERLQQRHQARMARLGLQA